jgi:spore coat protein CotH
VYIPADVTFDGETFRNVGFRLKGNSTLLFTWRRGSDKLPFRLNFDSLESRFPAARDQTFFGFPNLSFINQDLDPTYLRAKVVTDLFRDAGIPSAAASFIRIYLDRGTGSQYLGLYTMVEVPDNPMLSRVFGSDDGNLYKPNGTGGRWNVFTREGFPKRTNQDDEDWTDIQDAIDVLNEPKNNDYSPRPPEALPMPAASPNCEPRSRSSSSVSFLSRWWHCSIETPGELASEEPNSRPALT